MKSEYIYSGFCSKAYYSLLLIHPFTLTPVLELSGLMLTGAVWDSSLPPEQQLALISALLCENKHTS